MVPSWQKIENRQKLDAKTEDERERARDSVHTISSMVAALKEQELVTNDHAILKSMDGRAKFQSRTTFSNFQKWQSSGQGEGRDFKIRCR
jgi:hypothetical protein